MKSVLAFLSVCISLSLGDTVTPAYKGCFSTSFVEQYAFYYKFNQSLTLEQCIAACNSRLTRYMGLETDKSSSKYNHVFCGNDLAEVSPKPDINLCSPCPDNNKFSRGRNGFMAVYLLRDSTPLSLLLATNHGVDMLSDNKTTVKVPYLNNYIHPSLDYIYAKDMIVFATDKNKSVKSTYDPLTMKFSDFVVHSNHSNYYKNMAINFLTNIYNYGTTFNFTLDRGNSEPSARVTTYHDHIFIDPYNNTIFSLVKGINKIKIEQDNENTNIDYSLQYLHVETINALAMDIHEMLLYVILTFTGDTSTYLVSLDYKLCQVRVLFQEPKLENATALEVFRDDVVWLKDVKGVTTVYYCKLTLKCESVTEYQSNQKIHDFVIYHPEKQAPGRKRLCADMNCSHGCQLFSPFTARCTCPPGMKLGTNNFTCVSLIPEVILKSTSPPFKSTKTQDHCTTWSDLSTRLSEIKISKKNTEQLPTTTTASTTMLKTTSTTSSTTKSTTAPTPALTTTFTTAFPTTPTTKYSATSTTAFTTSNTTEPSTNADHTESEVSVLAGLPTEDISASLTSTEAPKNKKTPSCETGFFKSHSVCIIIILLMLLGVAVFFIKFYKKVTYYPQVVEEAICLNHNSN